MMERVNYSLFVMFQFQAYHSAIQLADSREKYDAFCIPIMVLPCTISNNVPGSDFSLGADTALNEITDVSYSNVLYTNYGPTMYH